MAVPSERAGALTATTQGVGRTPITRSVWRVRWLSPASGQVPVGIAAAMSGVPWWTSDVGGFGCPVAPHNDTDPYMQELIQRWHPAEGAPA